MDENHEIVDSDNQKKKRQKKERIVSLFPHHVIPDNLSLISLYELLVYIIVFLCLLNWYECFHHIPEFKHDIYIECLDSLWEQRSTIDFAQVEYYLPISSLFKDSKAHLYYDFERFSSETEENMPQMRVSKRFLDSLKKEYLGLLPDSAQNIGHLFYLKRTWPENPKSELHGGDVDFSILGYYQYGKTTIDTTGLLVTENYFNFPTNLGKLGDNTVNLTTPHGFGTPRFWSRRDITQGYYTVRLHTESLDSISLIYRFGGAVDIAAIGNPQPVNVSGDRVEYCLRPEFGYVTTLRFHVKYRDMENMQNRRVFLVTAFMSAILTIFLAFLIIYVYRILLEPIVRKRNDKIRREEQNHI